MTDQLHLVQGLVNGHRLSDVQLAADDDWGVVNLDLDGFARAEISGNGVPAGLLFGASGSGSSTTTGPGPDRPGPGSV